MAAASITVQVLSGSELQIMAQPGELVALVRQRVADQLIIGEFQEVKLCMGFEALRDDVSVSESGMLDSTVQAVLVTNVEKAKTDIQKIGTAVDVLLDSDYDSEDSRKLLQDLCRTHRLYSEGDLAVLAHMVPKRNSPVEALRALSKHLGQQDYNLRGNENVWIKLIDALTLVHTGHAQCILCALASFHSAAAVRAAAVGAVGAFGLAPVWAVRHIRTLKQIAWAVDGDPDDSVRDAAAASAQSLEDAQAQGRLPAIPPAMIIIPPALRGPLAARRNTEGGMVAEEAKPQQEQLQRSQEDSQRSKEEVLQKEQQALQEAILRSKADAWSSDGIILTRLTFHNPSVMSFLSTSNDLASCRATVESAGCMVQPAWANGALLLVPVTEQQILEADIDLQPHNILMLASDEPIVRHTLTQLARRKRPGLKPEHYPHGKFGYALTEAKSATAEAQPQPAAVGAWMQDVGIVVERTFLNFAIEKDISEASTMVQSAPAGGSASSGRMNPHQWRLPVRLVPLKFR